MFSFQMVDLCSELKWFGFQMVFDMTEHTNRRSVTQPCLDFDPSAIRTRNKQPFGIQMNPDIRYSNPTVFRMVTRGGHSYKINFTGFIELTSDFIGNSFTEMKSSSQIVHFSSSEHFARTDSLLFFLASFCSS